jgi:hypothetical protein
MDSILICTMGYSPGVVTRMTQYLQQQEPHLLEVWIVHTSKQAIRLLFKDIVLREFREGGSIQGLMPQEKVLSPEDTTHVRQVQTFADEFSEFLISKVTASGSSVHLCLSGGRKSMTHAATMAFVKLVAILKPPVVREKLKLWDIHLPSGEDVSVKDIEDLRRQYTRAQNITDDGEVDQRRRELLLYPPQAEIWNMPFLYLGELGFDRSQWIVLGRPNQPLIVDRLLDASC